MINIKRTNSDDKHFQQLVGELELELKIRDGDEHTFYAQLNTIDTLAHVIVAYDGDEPVGCGATRKYSQYRMEIKRMFVPVSRRGQGIASMILQALEIWCRELSFTHCVLKRVKINQKPLAFIKKISIASFPISDGIKVQQTVFALKRNEYLKKKNLA